MGARSTHAAALQEPAHLALRHDDGRECGGVERLVFARVLNSRGQRQELGDPASVGALLDAACPLDGSGGEEGDPQATVGAEGLLEGEVVGVHLREVNG